MKTAVIYARYSSDSQSEQSIEGQLRVCQEYAQKNDILILDTYVDRAMTGTNDNRPDFQRMIKDSNRKEWDYVLVYKLDRFSRDKYESTIHKRTLKNNGVKLLSAMENIPDTPEGIILESLLEGMNQYYSAELAQKVKRGMNESRLKGNFTGGIMIYGYSVVNKKIIINEQQAEVVRYIFEKYAYGTIVRDIITDLTAKGIFHNGKPFIKNNVYNLLRNEKYIGIYRHNDEVFENTYPPIVSKEIFERVQRIIKSNKLGKSSVKEVYLLRQKMVCGYCGCHINAETGTARDGEVKHYYKCTGRKNRNGCKKSIFRKEFLEKLIIDEIVNNLSQPPQINTMVDGLMQRQEALSRGTQTLALLNTEKKQTETAIKNILSAIEKGVVTDSTTSRLKELERQREDLTKQILLEKNKTSVKLSRETLMEYFEDAIKLEPKMLISYLVEKIVLYDDKIEIHYTSPIKKGPDENRGFCFAKKKVKLEPCNYIRKHIKQIGTIYFFV